MLLVPYAVDFGSQDEQTMNGVAMETPSDVAVALATKHGNMSYPPTFFLSMGH